MPRITNVEELFFPVETQPIFTRPAGSHLGMEIPISNRMAILNGRTNEVLGVVSKDYRLVTNREACDYARKCAQAVFEDTTEDEWEIFAVDAPPSATYCHVDLRHRTGKLDFGYVMVGTREDVPDNYGPYIRVTNSYNAQRALRFTIGCYRKVCANGMTAPGDIISFSFAHTRDKIQSDITFVVDHDRVRKMQQEFKAAFDGLRRYEFARKHGRKLVQTILAIRRPRNAIEEESNFNAFQSDWFRLEGYIDSLYGKYADRLGDNAYSALQAATELASHPLENLCLRKDKNTLQRLAGEWMVDFQRQCAEQAFDLSEYLGRSTHTHETLATSGRVLA
ncbi:MAG: DUF932 domain-containing protein [Defluviicoccus sp.]|nr:DUF932 domain-containing protein [Defluviicoccus sp.]MDE0276354.1 DUF932 domain-containing protein [Defluviicoccus sp.]